MLVVGTGFLVGVASPSHGGSGGLRNGGIQGAVYDTMGQPLEGVTVVAVREEGGPRIQRSVRTDGMGNYTFTDMYLGTWVLGFSRFGFEAITTESGDPDQQTAVGAQVRVFVGSGMMAMAPPVNLRADFPTQPGNLRLRIIDATDARPLTHATVTAGLATSNQGSAEGVYDLEVSVSFDDANLPIPTTVRVQAEGFEDQVVEITVVPEGATNPRRIDMSPRLVTLAGRVVLPPLSTQAEYDSIRVGVADLTPDLVNSTVEAIGVWQIRVPASTPAVFRQYDLRFSADGFLSKSFNGVLPPEVGTRTLPETRLERDPEAAEDGS